MIQKRINGQFLHEPSKSIFSDRLNEGQRFRYLNELPEFSAVVENQQARNTGTSEASLLEKLAVENDKMCSSSLFQDNKEKQFDTKIVEDMRFSFSNNDPVESDQKQSQCSDILARYHQEHNKSKGNFVSLGSESLDMRKRKEAIKEEIMNQSIETIKNKYIFNQKKSEQLSTEGLKGKGKSKIEGSDSRNSLDNVFNKVQVQTKKCNKFDILPLSKQALSTIKEKAEEQPLLHMKNSLERMIIERESIDPHYLQVVFQVLDRSKTGKIEKYNCNIEKLCEGLQLIFGVIFFRIKFNSEGFTKKQFTQLAFQCLAQVPHPPLDLLKELEASQASQKSIRNQQTSCQNCRSREKYEEKGVSLYHLLDSPPKHKMQPGQSGINLSKRPYVDMKETRFERNKAEEESETIQSNIVKEDKYAGKYIKKSENSSQLAQPLKASSQAKNQTMKIQQVKVEESPRKKAKDKENLTYKYITNPVAGGVQQKKKEVAISVTVPKKKRNISEEILQQHKKNLQELQKLNEKMESYIYHKLQSDAPHSEECRGRKPQEGSYASLKGR